jgi:hypothetical protein
VRTYSQLLVVEDIDARETKTLRFIELSTNIKCDPRRLQRQRTNGTQALLLDTQNDS